MLHVDFKGAGAMSETTDTNVRAECEVAAVVKRTKGRRVRSAEGQCCIPRSIFRAITREIVANKHGKIKLFDRKAIQAMQFESEQFLTDLFQFSNELALLSGHSTVGLQNLKAALHFYNRYKTPHA